MERTILGLFCFCLFLVAGCNRDKETSDSSADATSSESGEFNDKENGWGDRFNQSMSDSKQWLTEVYESAKENGTTTANSVGEWVADDWKAQGDWEYHIFEFAAGDDEELVKSLNELGEKRWECFHVDVGSDTRKFYMKRTRKSYLKNLPLKEVMEFLPTGEGGN